MRNWIGGILALVVLSAVPALGWEHWGGDRGGSRFAPLEQITSDNVGRLIEAWRFQTGDLLRRTPAQMARTKFEATPLLVEDSLDLLHAVQRGNRARSRQRPAEVAFRCRGSRQMCAPPTAGFAAA